MDEAAENRRASQFQHHCGLAEQNGDSGPLWEPNSGRDGAEAELAGICADAVIEHMRLVLCRCLASRTLSCRRQLERKKENCKDAAKIIS